MNKLGNIEQLIQGLNRSGLSYCHWKSNIALDVSLAGQTDIDLLIDRKSASQFRSILNQNCFRPAYQKGFQAFPSVEHYFSLDEETGTIVHVHAYFKVITGESLAKNYRFPIEGMLLQNTRVVDAVLVPAKSAELVVFTLRMMLKHTSLMELYLLSRYWKQAQKEMKWLLEDGSIEEAQELIAKWLPSVDSRFFTRCIEALNSPAPLLNRIILGIRLRRQLRPYARKNVLQVWLTTVYKFSTMFMRRLARSQKSMVLQNGGGMIAFVGSEATGKSTMIGEMQEWLGRHFAVKNVHIGKPKPTLISLFPNIFLPLFRSLFPGSRTTEVAERIDDQTSSMPLSESRSSFPLLYVIRSVLLAYDRWRLLSRASRQAANGMIVLCDRYPSSVIGAPDSPQLSNLPVTEGRISLRGWLAQLEGRLYREMPVPEIVIYLSAPLDITMQRNASRLKTEPEIYVRRRHARSANLEFGKIPVCKINTDQPLEKTVLEVKKALWTAL